VPSFIGVLIGAFLSNVTSDRQRRVAATFELHRELHDVEMGRVRFLASELVEKYSKLNYRQIQQEVGPDAFRDLTKIVYFFQRLWLSIEYKSIEKQYIPNLFGSIFSWWYNTSFKDQVVPSGSEAALAIESLWKWLEKNSTLEQREGWSKGDWRAWGSTTTQ
jgi:hypothetical protein